MESFESPAKPLPAFESVADALNGEEREEFELLSEHVSDIAAAHGGRVNDAELSSAEREVVDRHKQLKLQAMGNIRMAE